MLGFASWVKICCPDLPPICNGALDFNVIVSRLRFTPQPWGFLALANFETPPDENPNSRCVGCLWMPCHKLAHVRRTIRSTPWKSFHARSSRNGVKHHDHG